MALMYRVIILGADLGDPLFLYLKTPPRSTYVCHDKLIYFPFLHRLSDIGLRIAVSKSLTSPLSFHTPHTHTENTFCFVYRDLKGWIHTMTILVTNDELAKDVVGAEALLDRHRVRPFQWMKNLFYQA